MHPRFLSTPASAAPTAARRAQRTATALVADGRGWCGGGMSRLVEGARRRAHSVASRAENQPWHHSAELSPTRNNSRASRPPDTILNYLSAEIYWFSLSRNFQPLIVLIASRLLCCSCTYKTRWVALLLFFIRAMLVLASSHSISFLPLRDWRTSSKSAQECWRSTRDSTQICSRRFCI